ncbi:hypothetical protein HNP84_007937 [Thermocatellispora tengchongensis]|uniref:WXG100 family type VII secretion target n=1 Tax=Thermocatellispora tengchongensis TaxID=1073253 RepID=A0A840P9X4_9ACTN|nr:hypothetical protein [Thermocatellispora tengchongensis]
MADPDAPGGASGPRAETPTDVDPRNLVKREQDFYEEHTAVVRAVADAMERLAALGNFWGDDSDGRRFYEGAEGRNGYRAASAAVESHAANLAEAYLRIGNDLVIAGTNIQGANWDTIAQMVRKVDQHVETPETDAEVT